MSIGLKRCDVASAIGVETAELAEIERGQRAPEPKQIVAISAQLAVSLESLFIDSFDARVGTKQSLRSRND